MAVDQVVTAHLVLLEDLVQLLELVLEATLAQEVLGTVDPQLDLAQQEAFLEDQEHNREV